MVKRMDEGIEEWRAFETQKMMLGRFLIFKRSRLAGAATYQVQYSGY